MISLLKGTIESETEKYVIIDVNGVGYKVHISGNTFKNLPKKGEKIKLYTYLYVRENIMDLYGFLNLEELEIFELLISISGIGPRGALSVLTVVSIETLKKAIANEESDVLTKVSGIGKKMAEKIVLELKNKIGEEFSGKGVGVDGEAIDALMSLGYKLQEARETLKKIPKEAESIEDRVREALKLLGR
jgi:Holliday junction DNA helicase RuvA